MSLKTRELTVSSFSLKQQNVIKKWKPKEFIFLLNNFFYLKKNQLNPLLYSDSITSSKSKTIISKNLFIQIINKILRISWRTSDRVKYRALSCICQQEVMLENVKYNLGKKYDFMQQSYQANEAWEGRQFQLEKKQQKRDKHKNNPSSRSTGGRPRWEKKKTICSIYLPTTGQVNEEDLRDFLEQLPAPTIILRDFSTHNPLWESKKMSKKGECQRKYSEEAITFQLSQKMKGQSLSNNSIDGAQEEQIECSFREKAE